MKDILVLCYHAVSDTWPDPLAIRPDDLARQLEHLLGKGYAPATFTDAVTDPPAGRTVVVTFDDGYRSVVERGLPVLERLGVPATLFVPTEQIATGRPMAWPGIDQWLATPHADELVGASWEQVAALAGAGWEIGSHSRTHPHLTEIDDEDLGRELLGSRQDLERRLGRPCPAVAYPYGDVDGRVMAAARDAGYRTAAALPRRLPRVPEPMAWPRMMIPRDEPERAYRRHVSRGFRLLQAWPTWGIVTRLVARTQAFRG